MTGSVGARGGGGGGSTDTGPCEDVFTLGGTTETWIVTPNDTLWLNEPDPGTGVFKSVFIEAISCGGASSADTEVSLVDPENHALILKSYRLRNEETRSEATAYYYYFTGAEIAGLYRLEITRASQRFTKDYWVRDYLDTFEGPRFTLLEPLTGHERKIFKPGDTIQVNYYTSWETELEVGLYRVDDVQFTLIDVWTIRTNSSGEASQLLPVPISMSSGSYLLAVDDLGSGYFEPVGRNLIDAFRTRFYYYDHFTITSEIIIYADGEVGRADLYTIEIDGSNRHRLTGPNRFDEAEPDWSPDNRYIVYQSNEAGNYDIWRMDADGHNRRQLTTSTADEREPDWSPDGTQIVYRRGGQANRDGELWVMNADGGNQRLLGDTLIQGRSPVWSPSWLEMVAFMSERTGRWQIYLYHLGTGKTEQVTNCQTHCRFPNWVFDPPLLDPSGLFLNDIGISDNLDLLFHRSVDLSNMTSSAVLGAYDSSRNLEEQDAKVLTTRSGHGRPARSKSGWIVVNGANGLEILNGQGTTNLLIPNTEDAFAPDWSN